jgi:rhodanese-related sulfurtransferase
MARSEIDVRDAHASRKRFRVIDVREPQEFHGPLGHIEGAELLPLGTVAEQAETLRDGRPLLLVCRSGKRSDMACQQLASRGCDDVTNLVGGMIGWNRAGLPVERTEPECLAALVEQIVAWAGQVGPTPADVLRERTRARFDAAGVAWDDPTHRAVEDVIELVEASLADAAPPDLELSLAAFRRSLAVL